LIELPERLGLLVEQEMLQKLSLRAKDRHLLYFKLSTFIDDVEPSEGVIVGVINCSDDFFVV
jgi:hypothetical protein